MKRKKANSTIIDKINKSAKFLNELQNFTNGILHFILTFKEIEEEQRKSLLQQQVKKQESPYEILGVSEEDPLELIKEIYRTKAKFYHPDKGGTDKKFIKIDTAYKKILKTKAGE